MPCKDGGRGWHDISTNQRILDIAGLHQKPEERCGTNLFKNFNKELGLVTSEFLTSSLHNFEIKN
jgi:hypothetical protein